MPSELDGLEALAPIELARMVLRYRDALREIKTEQGRVCGEFEFCRHDACQSSYSAWAIADAALTPLNEVKG